MVRFGDMERIVYGPPNFYNWCQQAKEYYLNRFQGWTACCNGIPWSLGGREVVNHRGTMNHLRR